jgi:hypothetical protein
VVCYQCQVFVVFPPRDLIDPDHKEVVEATGVEFITNNAPDDSAYGAPCDPHQAGDCGLICAGSQPRHQRLEICGEI